MPKQDLQWKVKMTNIMNTELHKFRIDNEDTEIVKRLCISSLNHQNKTETSRGSNEDI